MTGINAVSSYCLELEGIYRTLKHIEYLKITPRGEVVQWCDNNQSVEPTQERPYRLTDMIRADADLVLAIHTIKEKLEFPTTCHHVYGHQDARQRRKRLKDKKKEGQTQAKEPCRENNIFGQKQQVRPRTVSDDE